MTNNTTALTADEVTALLAFASRIEDAEESPIPVGVSAALVIRKAIALLTSPRAAVPAPEGWKLVPIVPTEEMILAGRNAAPLPQRYAAMLDAAPAAPVASAPTLTLTGAQLLEALDLIAPDRSADQLESEVSFQNGNGHDGEGMYCWATEYPDECAMKIDGSTVAAQAVAADGASDFSAWLATKSEAWWEDTSLEKIAEDAWNASRAAVSQSTAPADAREPSAWVTPEGDRSITQSQKQGMLRDGGAGASSVQPFSIACYAGRVPADAGEALAKPRDCSGTPESCPDNEGYGCHCSDTVRVEVLPGVVRVCEISDAECSRKCGMGPCKKESDQGAQGGKGGEA